MKCHANRLVEHYKTVFMAKKVLYKRKSVYNLIAYIIRLYHEMFSFIMKIITIRCKPIEERVSKLDWITF